MIRLFFVTPVSELSEEVIAESTVSDPSPVHHGVAIAFHVSGVILAWGGVGLILC